MTFVHTILYYNQMKAKGFDWDRGNWPKCGKHGLSKAEIEYVLTNQPMVLPDRYPVDIEARFNAVGKNQEGRYIFVVFTRRIKTSGWIIRPIGARYMHKKEIENYEQQKKS